MSKLKSFKQFLNEFELEGEKVDNGNNPGIEALHNIESKHHLDIQGPMIEYIEDNGNNPRAVKGYITLMLDEIDEYVGNMDLNNSEADEFEDNLYTISQYSEDVYNYLMK